MEPTPVKPAAGQESVWDYPRPPALEPVSKHIRILFNGEVIADSNRAYRVLETSHPPVYYILPEDLNPDYVQDASGSSFCEWKGKASYKSVKVGEKLLNRVGWTYPNPTKRFEPIRDYVAFYAGPMDACYVGDEKVIPQPGGFYGGWITSDVVGPFKGIPGSMGW